MFYVDDVVFVGQWCDDNINTLVYVLECFFRASGLRINMSKSKIMGVNVGDDKIKAAASKLGCLILNTPFTYLGTKVGGNMSRVQAWTEIVDKVKSRLSKWKLKSLSIGALEEESAVSVQGASDLLIRFVLNPCPDRWLWSLEGRGSFLSPHSENLCDQRP
ncbi:RNA-directed DNA polymerase, eukaryota, reverse transcriptase zinc-binding domain protein [Tanacetum coccineum]